MIYYHWMDLPLCSGILSSILGLPFLPPGKDASQCQRLVQRNGIIYLKSYRYVKWPCLGYLQNCCYTVQLSMALLHVSHPPVQTCGGEDILYIFFLIFPGHPEFWTPLQILIWGPPWLHPVTVLLFCCLGTGEGLQGVQGNWVRRQERWIWICHLGLWC